MKLEEIKMSLLEDEADITYRIAKRRQREEEARQAMVASRDASIKRWTTSAFITLTVLVILIASSVQTACAGEYEDNRAAEAAAEEAEYIQQQEDAMDDHANGLENSDSEHSLAEHAEQQNNW